MGHPPGEEAESGAALHEHVAASEANCGSQQVAVSSTPL